MDRISTQSEWQQRARAVLPAGGFGNFDAGMIMDRGIGSRIWDMDGNEYVDYLIGSGPMLLGHGHPEVMEAVLEQLPKGQTFLQITPLVLNWPRSFVMRCPAPNSCAMSQQGERRICMRSALHAPIRDAKKL